MSRTALPALVEQDEVRFAHVTVDQNREKLGEFLL